MKITIDTKTDSKEEIQKVISMLQSVVGGEMYTNYLQQNQAVSSQESQPSLSNSSQEPAMPTALGDFFTGFDSPVSTQPAPSSPSPEVVDVSKILEEYPKTLPPKIETYY